MTEQAKQTIKELESTLTALREERRCTCGPPSFAYEEHESKCPLHENQTLLTRRASEGDSPRQPAAPTDWRPIETLPDDIKVDGAVIFRPHVIYGAMDVRWKPGLYGDGKHYNWINGDYTTAWPDDALLPFWMPVPPQPKGEL